VKVLIFGLGSIGSRHANNLRISRADAITIGADPQGHWNESLSIVPYSDWHTALATSPDADAAIIASPTEAHLDQAIALRDAGIPFYLEKPIGTLDQIEQFARMNVNRCAVGYQYRFHPVYREAASIIRDSRSVRFAANDDLLDRYGPDCLSYIAAHPIDTALWLLGSAVDVDIVTNGFSAWGTIRHERGAVSKHEYRIDRGPRLSLISAQEKAWSLGACNDMYLNALSAWLAWVGGAERDERTATLADGLAALEVMSKVRRI